MGSTLSIGGVSTTQIKGISQALGGEVSVVEATTLGSTVREYVSGIGAWGSLEFEVVYDPGEASHAAFKTLIETPAEKACIVTLSDTSTIGFDAFVTGFNVNGLEIDGVVSASITLQITGAVTITPAAGG